MLDFFVHLSAEAWTAIGTIALAFATLVLVAVGFRQLRSIRAEAKKERTLAICHRYDIDPVLDVSLRSLWILQTSGNKTAKELKKHRPDIVTVLNYLDSIAVGIEQELYIEELARDHIESIVKTHVEQYLKGTTPKSAGLNPDHYKSLTKLCDSWSEVHAIRYRDGTRSASKMWKYFRRST